jgi:ATP-binding cassette subfamily B protein
MIRKLASSIGEYKKAAWLTPFFVSLECVMDVLIPFIMAWIIDDGINVGNMNYIVKWGLLLVLVAFLGMLTGVLAGRFAAVASAGFAKNLRRDMYYRVQDYSFANIDKFSTASIITRITTDVNNVQFAFQMIIRIAVRSPLMLVFCLLAAMRIHSGLALIFVGIIPVLGVGLALIAMAAHGIFERVFTLYDHLNSDVEENVRAIRVVKTFTREAYETRKFQGVSAELCRLFTKAEKIIAFNGPLMQTCLYTCLLLISWFGAKAVVASGGDPVLGLSTGELMSLLTYVMQILIALMTLSFVFVMIVISRASAERIDEVLTEESEIKNPTEPLYEVPDGSIEFRHADFSYAGKADRLCLFDIDFSVRSGETIGIIGGTGAGKTTLVQLIPRLYDVTRGDVLVGGHNVKEYDLETLRNSVAMVLQKNLLFSGSIRENLRWGDPEASDEALVHACRLAQADDFIREFPDGYDTHIEQGGSNVSGGQRQRLCIARALLKQPRILILDDSTSAVDTATDARIRRAFREELPETTKLIIAQRISSVQDADRIIVLDGGRVNAIGTHEELLEHNEIYREVYLSQQKGGEADAAGQVS